MKNKQTKLSRLLLIAWIVGSCASQARAAPNVSVAFVLDESGSITASNFELETKGFVSALNAMTANGKIEVSVIGFATGTEVLADKILLDASGANAIEAALTRNPQSEGWTNMGAAIDVARRVLEHSVAPSKVICLATDGEPATGGELDDELAAANAASSARSLGINLSPIGIGLESGGKLFLDSIASDPPVPNPADFKEFADVVENVCVGIVQSALNIELTPDTVEFGTTTANAEECAAKESVSLVNHSDKPATITGVQITGEDAREFALVSIKDVPVDDISFPFELPAHYQMEIVVSVVPETTPPDESYDAVLEVSGVDEVGTSGEFTARLNAPLANASGSCFSVSVLDASPTIVRIDDSGTAINGSGNILSEQDVTMALQHAQLGREGVVADGNARLFLTARAPGISSGNVRFELGQPVQTEARLYSLNANQNSNGQASVIVPITLDPNGGGQATAILRAGERFLGVQSAAEVSFQVRACVVDQQGVCTEVGHSFSLREKRAPVVLIHGLWASTQGDDGKWHTDTWASQYAVSEGVYPKLKLNHFRVGMFNYDGNKGPTQVMAKSASELAEFIKVGEMSNNDGAGLCNHAVNEGLSCTRVDFVAHSMGGLVARKFIYDNENYASVYNFEQGAVRRFITLATPHEGSQLANLLLFDNESIGGCIEDQDDAKPGVQNEHIEKAINLLACHSFEGCEATERPEDAKLVDQGAIADLAIDSELLDMLKGEFQMVESFALFGDVGKRIELDYGSLTDNLVEYRIYAAGCEYEDLYGAENSDGIVSVASAQGRIDKTESLGQVYHVGMGSNYSVSQRVVELLNAPRDSFSSVAEGSYYASSLASNVIERRMPIDNKSVPALALENMAKAAIAAVVPFFGLTPVLAGEQDIVLSADKIVVEPGEIVKFSANVNGSVSSPLYLTDGYYINLADNAAPYRWDVILPATFAGVQKYKVEALVDGDYRESNEVEVNVVPNAALLSQIEFEPPEVLLLTLGDAEQLRVIGSYKDGYKRELTQQITGTVYDERIVDGLTVSEGDSSVLGVSSGGVVKAESLGEAEVVAENNGFRATRRVVVVTSEDPYSSSEPPDEPEAPQSSGGGGAVSALFALPLAMLLGYRFFQRRRKGLKKL